jgi:eukaryotic-like serine/threonine-protein kinase
MPKSNAYPPQVQPESTLPGKPPATGFPPLRQYIDNGRYCLLHLHESGGMARVYRALDTHLGREVAVKILAPELTTDGVSIERFRREARRVAALQHPHIVPLLSYGEEGSFFYLVMPFVTRTLRDAFQKRRAFPLSDVVTLVTQVSSALDYAHELGIIHRDVKPENILLDDEGQAVLGDFGIAKADAYASRQLATGLPLAEAEAGRPRILSLEYAAPEFLMGKPIDRRSDIYGLGVVVYEMLTGHRPFPVEDDVSAVILRILSEQATPPSLLAPTLLPFTTDAVVLKAIERELHRRYATVGEFSAALAETLAVPVGNIPYEYPSRPPLRSIPLQGSYATTPLRPRRFVLRSSPSWLGKIWSAIYRRMGR